MHMLVAADWETWFILRAELSMNLVETIERPQHPIRRSGDASDAGEQGGANQTMDLSAFSLLGVGIAHGPEYWTLHLRRRGTRLGARRRKHGNLLHTLA